MGSFIKGLKLGAIIGGVLGVFFTPKTGEENRKWVKKVKDENQEKLDKAVKSGKKIADDGVEKTQNIVKKIKKKTPAAKNKKKK